MDQQLLDRMVNIAARRLYGNGPLTIQSHNNIEAALMAALRLYEDAKK